MMVEDETTDLAVVTDDVLDAAEAKATAAAQVATVLLRSMAPSSLRPTITAKSQPDWRAPALYLATALTEAMTEAGLDPAVVLTTYAERRGALEALSRDIARRERDAFGSM